MEAQMRDIAVVLHGHNWPLRASDFESNLEEEIELMRQFQAGIPCAKNSRVGVSLVWVEPRVKEEKQQGLRSEE